jgi:hypothetical protein
MSARAIALAGWLTLAIAAPATALAAPGGQWRRQDVAPPAVAPNGRLAAVSCARGMACVAVGSSIDRRGLRVTLAERRSARGWEIERTDNPPEATAALAAVSCPTPTGCMAVGHATDDRGRVRPLAERWDGAAWTIEATPDPGAPETSLEGVSCTAMTSCVAVGVATDADGRDTALAERWDGARWRADPALPGAPTLTTRLHAVSCAGPSACTAVGDAVDANGSNLRTALAERWDGSRWQLQQPAASPEAKEQTLTGVSCPTDGSCVAVGSLVAPKGRRAPLAERWDATGWQLEAAADPAAAGSSAELDAVSCSSAARCSAAGSLDGQPLAEHRDGGRWTSDATPAPAGSPAGLTGISCIAAQTCSAVGSLTSPAGYELALALAEDAGPGGWRREAIASPSGATDAELVGVACTARAACVAVGNYRSAAGDRRTLAERWDGARWRRLATADPAGSRDSRLLGVACLAPDACVAVGSTVDASHTEVALVERYDGASWQIQPTQDFDAELAARLQSVSCTTSRACTAVGFVVPVGGGEQALAERWDGTSWTRQVVPSPDGFVATPLGGVSCPAITRCAAVGDWPQLGAIQRTVTAARWDPSGWQLQSPPAPADTVRSGLIAVSCASAEGCVAVGDANPVPAPHPGLPLVERWDGTRWRVEAAPAPAGTDDSPLAAVSCSATRSCSAVGAWFDAVGYRTLAERWDGARWAIEPTPDAPGADDVLTGVSCAGPSACIAVGETSMATPLVVRYSGEDDR